MSKDVDMSAIAFPKEKDKPRKDHKKIGRPSVFTEELSNKILARIMDGENLTAICNDEGMPHRDTIYNWLVIHKGFSDLYARAKEIQAHHFVDEILLIADSTAEDDIFTKDGNRIANSEWIARSRLRVDTRKWIVSKVLPKIYGDKIEVDNKGEIGVNITIKNFQLDNKGE